MARARYRVLAIGLTVVSAVVFVLYLTGPGQCAVPLEPSLSLYGPPMLVRPALCAVDSVVPVWLLAVAGISLGLAYLLLARGSQRAGSLDLPGD
jgi:hypothetical protein